MFRLKQHKNSKNFKSFSKKVLTLTRKRVIISTTKAKKNKQTKERLIKMKKYNRSEIFKRAWAIKKSENTTMSIALKRAWAEAKAPNGKTVEEYLKSTGLKVWEKGSHKRIYINDLISLGFAKDFNKSTQKSLSRGITLYYECNEDAFYYTASSSRKEHVKELIAKIRNSAKTA